MSLSQIIKANFLMLFIVLPLRASGSNIDVQLATIDSLITHYDATCRKRIAFIDSKVRTLAALRDIEQRFALMRQVLTLYTYFNTDSALVYSNRLSALARASGKRELMAQAYIDRAGVIGGAGELSESEKLLERIHGMPMSRALRRDYFGQLYFLYARYAAFNDHGGVNRDYYYEREFAYADSTLSLMASDDPYAPLYKGWKLMRQGQYAQGIRVGENYLAFRPEETIMRSEILYMMSVCSKMAGKEDQELDLLFQAAINDLRLANNNSEVMAMLADRLCSRGYIAEAYKLINFGTRMAMQQKNRVRLVVMQNSIGTIQQAYSDKITRQSQHLKLLLGGIGLLVVALLLTLLYIMRQHRKLRLSGQKLEHSNAQLARSNNDLNTVNGQLAAKVEELSRTYIAVEEAKNKLEDANTLLNRANADLGEKNIVKEEYIGFVLSLCSDYISRLDNYRKDINRKVKTHMYAELNDMTNTSVMMQSELKEFYLYFDTVFLHVYPGFVADFNQLLRPEEQLHPKEGRLNTELRIFALMRLGITDSSKIADFFHCSLQTVYNNRLRIRQKAINRETFDEEVRHLERAKSTTL